MEGELDSIGIKQECSPFSREKDAGPRANTRRSVCGDLQGVGTSPLPDACSQGLNPSPTPSIEGFPSATSWAGVCAYGAHVVVRMWWLPLRTSAPSCAIMGAGLRQMASAEAGIPAPNTGKPEISGGESPLRKSRKKSETGGRGLG